MRSIESTFIDPVVGKPEFRRALGVSNSTFDRWLAESRQAIAEDKTPILPAPLFTGGKKRRLMWSRSVVRNFLENRNSGIPQPSSDSMSEAERQRKHTAAMKELAELGVAVKQEAEQG